MSGWSARNVAAKQLPLQAGDVGPHALALDELLAAVRVADEKVAHVRAYQAVVDVNGEPHLALPALHAVRAACVHLQVKGLCA